jgi:hypothetical protein
LGFYDRVRIASETISFSKTNLQCEIIDMLVMMTVIIIIKIIIIM